MAMCLKRVFTFLPLLLLATHPPVFAEKWVEFEAVRFEYNLNAVPEVSQISFKSYVYIFNQGAVKVVQIKNFIKSKSKHDALIKIAISSSSAGIIVYDGEDNTIAEYGKAVIASNNLYTFDEKSGDNQVSGSWFIENDYMMSDFTLRSPKGILLYKETVIYTAKYSRRGKKRR